MARAARTPRVGILVECGRDGLEVHLCTRICALLREHHGAIFQEEIVPMTNKKRLLEEAAQAAASLFAQRFDRVVILWDEEPAWPDKKQSLCWHLEKEQLLQVMRGTGVNLASIHLLKTWTACGIVALFDDLPRRSLDDHFSRAHT